MEREPLDSAYVADVLSKPPFVTISGVINARDLGNYPSSLYPGKRTRPRLLYRSGELGGVTDEGLGCHSNSVFWILKSIIGKEDIRRLGISTVFDLRSGT
jgi:hypothetical protein